MKIKLYLIFCIFFSLSFLSFGKNYKSIEALNTFHLEVKEENLMGKNKKEIHYDVLISLPNQFKKTVSYPKMNEGEIYLYLGESKTVYLPIFKQTKTSKVDQNENQVIQVIQLLRQKLKKDPKFKKKYYQKEKITFPLENGYTVIFYEYIEQDQYLFPVRWMIQENGNTLLEINISKVIISPKFSEEDFKIP